MLGKETVVKEIGLILCCAVFMPGCFVVENILFPVWPENYFDTPPSEEGPYTVNERRVENLEGADCLPFGVTIFEPVGLEGPQPAFFWVMASNVQAYYHQSLHETLASWGYLVLVPDTRPLQFADVLYHERLVAIALRTFALAEAGMLEVSMDPNRVVFGGYSTGAPIAALCAAREPRAAGLVYWAPAGPPYWAGLNANALFPLVNQPALYVLGDLDPDALAGGYVEHLQGMMPDSPFTTEMIENGTHHQFQQPVGADISSPPTPLSRFEQMGRAITATREFLDTLLSD